MMLWTQNNHRLIFTRPLQSRSLQISGHQRWGEKNPNIFHMNLSDRLMVNTIPDFDMKWLKFSFESMTNSSLLRFLLLRCLVISCIDEHSCRYLSWTALWLSAPCFHRPPAAAEWFPNILVCSLTVCHSSSPPAPSCRPRMTRPLSCLSPSAPTYSITSIQLSFSPLFSLFHQHGLAWISHKCRDNICLLNAAGRPLLHELPRCRRNAVLINYTCGDILQLQCITRSA